MLGTCNLTFNLGNGAIPTSSNFQIWYENTTYNPSSRGVEYSPGSFESGTPTAYNLTNITPTSSHGMYSGDGSSWAAEALWNTSALWAFSNLSGVLAAGWLRAVEGSWHGVKTLTIWGKLSWGANPLVSSTIHDGIADGSRVNPVSAVGIELSSVFGNASGSLSNGAGYAMEMTIYNGTGTSGPVEYSNYSVQALIDHTDIQNYSVTLPVSQLSQFTTVKFQVIANNSSVLSPMWLSSSTKSFSRTIDLVNYTSTTFAYDGNGLKTYWGQISGKIQTVWTGGKVPTWLWLPDDNSTVNGLPLGLERYTGEQSFDLVVVNSSQSITSSQIPYPWGGEDPNRVVLSPGLNDFLVPREQFLDSPLGQAIFLGKNTSYNSSDPYPALVGTSARGVIAHFDGANWMVDLGAYWQNRAINSGQTGNITPSTETGTSSTSNLQVQVTATTATLANNTGGVPGVTDLYNSSGVPAALQAIVTLNATNVTTLNLVLAGLLDNTSGLSHGVNGTFQEVTSYTESLNLVPSVLSAIPNAAIGGDGLYGAPVSVPPPPTSSAWGSFWNAVTSVVENPLGAILSLETIVWSATVAATTYLNHLAHEAAALGGALIARATSAIIRFGHAFLSALELLLSFISSLIVALLSRAFGTVSRGMSQYAQQLGSELQQAYNDSNLGKSLVSDAAQFWADVGGDLFFIAIGVASAIEIALTILEVLTVGAAFIVLAVIGILLTGVLAGVAAAGGPSYLSHFEGMDPLSPTIATVWEDIFDPPAYLTTLGQILDCGSVAWTATAIFAAYSGSVGPAGTQIAGLALGVLGFVVSVAAATAGSEADAVPSLFFASAGVILSGVGILEDSEEPLIGGVGILLDTSTIALDAYSNGWY